MIGLIVELFLAAICVMLGLTVPFWPLKVFAFIAAGLLALFGVDLAVGGKLLKRWA